MTAMGSFLRGEHHVASFREERDRFGTFKLAEFKGTKLILFVKGCTAPPHASSAMRPFDIAIRTIIEFINITDINERFKFQGAAVAVIAACILDPLI